MNKLLIYAIILGVLGIGLVSFSIILGSDSFFYEGPAEVFKERNADYDGDGLTNHEEDTDFMTDKSKKDTDGDGLNDGDEVYKYFTNPLETDTDGDGYDDKVEIDGGYDPNKKA